MLLCGVSGGDVSPVAVAGCCDSVILPVVVGALLRTLLECTLRKAHSRQSAMGFCYQVTPMPRLRHHLST